MAGVLGRRGAGEEDSRGVAVGWAGGGRGPVLSRVPWPSPRGTGPERAGASSVCPHPGRGTCPKPGFTFNSVFQNRKQLLAGTFGLWVRGVASYRGAGSCEQGSGSCSDAHPAGACSPRSAAAQGLTGSGLRRRGGRVGVGRAEPGGQAQSLTARAGVCVRLCACHSCPASERSPPLAPPGQGPAPPEAMHGLLPLHPFWH